MYTTIIMYKTANLRALAVALLLLALAGAVRADGATLALIGAAPLSGGGALSGGGYALAGAIGQPVTEGLAAGEYELTSGAIGAAGEERVYLPLMRQR